MNGPRIGFVGSGAYVPETVLTNADLERLVDTSDEWIRRRTGIQSRRVLDGRESILDMAVKASQRAMDDAGVTADEIDEIRVAVNTWMRLPSLATQIQTTLGVKHSSASDVSAGCAGFVYAVEDVWHKMLCEREIYGRKMKSLVVGVDGLSHITDWTDRSTCVLLGDGAGAVVMGEVEQGGILATHTKADGRLGKLLYSEEPIPLAAVSGTGGPQPRVDDVGARQYLRMDGRRVFVAAVETMVSDVRRVLEKYRMATGTELGVDDVDYIYPHQANLRIIEKVASKLKVPQEKVYRDGIVQFGNTSAASIPLGYEDTRASPKRPRPSADRGRRRIRSRLRVGRHPPRGVGPCGGGGEQERSRRSRFSRSPSLLSPTFDRGRSKIADLPRPGVRPVRCRRRTRIALAGAPSRHPTASLRARAHARTRAGGGADAAGPASGLRVGRRIRGGDPFRSPDRALCRPPGPLHRLRRRHAGAGESESIRAIRRRSAEGARGHGRAPGCAGALAPHRPHASTCRFSCSLPIASPAAILAGEAGLEDVDAVLQPASLVAGVVVTAEGEAAGGARVALHPFPGEEPEPSPVATAATDTLGAFRLRVAEEGRFLLVATWMPGTVDDASYEERLGPASAIVDVSAAHPPSPRG